MGKLDITKLDSGRPGLITAKITGFSEGELSWLKGLPHFEAWDKLLEMLDNRNDNLGTCWRNGYGIYGLWFDNEGAYMNIGSTCD